MIDLQNISVVFERDGHSFKAVDDVSLTVEAGDIYGIVGYSGAGKSTLVRTINLLQPPTNGEVYVAGENLTDLSVKELRDRRKKIGMIFQHFNLMNARTILGNVLYPLKDSSMSEQEKKDKAMRLLKLVGIEEKAGSYPSELSGGQKQRVAIARALANDPEILLCDEATSALDPRTTTSILHLLKRLNRDMGLTIVLITHEMQAVKEICNKVAVMESGRVVESGSLIDIFANPTETITRQFVETASHWEETIDKLSQHGYFDNDDPRRQLIHLQYVGSSATEPILNNVYTEFHVATNILSGSIEFLEDVPFGNLVVLFQGEPDAIERSKKFLLDNDVDLEVVTKEVI
ncbi:MAG: methionine ABC transporter ATP-binding protein [Peptoniphilus sp.]|nr:methionine ABC transporter ATP-binding protein [Peptoniphilus sp.]MDD7363259.1 methionine ABC transporter ATP-binding protein [Bacillota bacterium]MDY6045352.1 methionine ABC transporter ATP-binding protein [Peptoniphilus sp.]